MRSSALVVDFVRKSHLITAYIEFYHHLQALGGILLVVVFRKRIPTIG